SGAFAAVSSRSTTARRSPRGPSRPSGTHPRCSRRISAAGPAVLRLAGVVTYYGPIQVLKAIDLEVRAGEIVCLLGGNASGKSTTMKTILGIVRPRQGTVEFEGQRSDGLATEAIVSRG